MAEKLLQAADAAEPFDYALLPKGVSVVLGYIGQAGETPHVWSTAEAGHARKTVGAWAPIWVPPQGAMRAEDGHVAGVAAVQALRQYDYPEHGPVFFDVEEHSYAANPAGALAAVEAFRQAVHAHGSYVGIGYLPAAAKQGWVAHWVKRKPATLPVSIAGQQWTNAKPGQPFDLSVFHPSVFAALTDPPKVDPVPTEAVTQQYLVDQLRILQGNIEAHIDLLHSGGKDGKQWPRNVVSTYDLVATVNQTLNDHVGASLDVKALAADLASQLGTDVARAVVALLAKHLAAPVA
jgi:hypothetical protein